MRLPLNMTQTAVGQNALGRFLADKNHYYRINSHSSITTLAAKKLPNQSSGFDLLVPPPPIQLCLSLMLFQEVDINGPIPDKSFSKSSPGDNHSLKALNPVEHLGPRGPTGSHSSLLFFPIRLTIIWLEFEGKQLIFRALITNPHLSPPLLRFLQPKHTRSCLLYPYQVPMSHCKSSSGLDRYDCSLGW
uniref:Uncharacterized protein n=1 Tax=Micrurus lemniscatus lemniscatus TaxID=129467 RepID=A0A2D4IIU2_MICLE